MNESQSQQRVPLSGGKSKETVKTSAVVPPASDPATPEGFRLHRLEILN